jgi:hypothetical protein
MTELTKRDVLKALGAAGIAVGGGAALLEWTANESFNKHDRQTLHAVATTVYPSDLDGIESFVDGYISRRVDADPQRATGIATAVRALDDYAQRWENDTFRTLDSETRDETLKAMGVPTAEPAPDGGPRQRVRYYLVNELLFALYSSPTGGELVGLENPQGHPGGTNSYQEPPN